MSASTPASKHRRFRSPVPLPGRWGLLLGALGLALFALARALPGLAESLYGRGAYPPIARVLAEVSGIVPFSIAEWVFAAIPVSLLIAPWQGFRGARQRLLGVPLALLHGATKTLGRAGTWWFLFVALWGLNYARPITAAPFGLGPAAPREARRELVDRIGAHLDGLREGVPEAPGGFAATPEDIAALDVHLRELQAAALAEAGLPAVEKGRVKRFLFSPLMLRWSVSGVYGPFTGEPNVTWPSAPALVPFTMAHERAHLAGFASEEMASFVALLTCWRSPRAEVRYAGWLALWLELERGSKGRAPGVVRDIRAIADFVKEHRGAEAPTVWKAYSGYLKAHGVPGGVRSYGRVAELALRWLDAHGIPAPPA